MGETILSQKVIAEINSILDRKLVDTRVPLVTDYVGPSAGERARLKTESKKRQLEEAAAGTTIFEKKQHNYSGDSVWVDLPTLK